MVKGNRTEVKTVGCRKISRHISVFADNWPFLAMLVIMQEYLGVYQARIIHLVSLLQPPSSARLVMASFVSSMGSHIPQFVYKYYLENKPKLEIGYFHSLCNISCKLNIAKILYLEITLIFSKKKNICVSVALYCSHMRKTVMGALSQWWPH